MKRERILIIGVVLIFALSLGCATLQGKRAILGVADWYVTNHELLAVEYTNSSAEHMQWLWENVLPYMNVMKYGIIGLDAVNEDNSENLSFAINGLNKWSIKVDYDCKNLIIAIENKDYDAIERECLALKNLIIMKWVVHE